MSTLTSELFLLPVPLTVRGFLHVQDIIFLTVLQSFYDTAKIQTIVYMQINFVAYLTSNLWR